MQRQIISELSEEGRLAVAIRQGTNIGSRVDGIAALNLTDPIHLDQVPHSYLLAVNDPKYGGSGPPPVDLDRLKLTAWLAANCDVPDGLVCWQTDPKPGVHGPRWRDWSGAKLEYLKRKQISETNPDHEKPVYIRMPPIREDAVWEAQKAWLGSYLERTAPLCDNKGKILPAHVAEHKKITTRIALTKTERAVPEMHTCGPRPVDINCKVPAVVRNYRALRLRDKQRTSDVRLLFSFEDAAKQVRYQDLCFKYCIHPVNRRGQCLSRFVTGNMMLHITIQPAKQDRHADLAIKYADKFTTDFVEHKNDPELPPVESMTGWLGMSPIGAYIPEIPQENHTDTPEAEASAVKEPVMRPTEEQIPQEEDIRIYTSYADSASYDKHLESVEKGYITPGMQNIWLLLHYRLRYSGALTKYPLRGRTERTSKYVAALQSPPKLEVKDSDSPPVALASSSPKTLGLLLGKERELRDYMHSVGGPSSFVQSAESGLYLPPSDFDTKLPW